MRAVVTPDEMAAIDDGAPEPVEELIARAGWATAQAGLSLLAGSSDRPGAYGKRIAVLVGKGNNGADGRAAIPHFERAGARCQLLEIDRLPMALTHPVDLVVDAAFGTGLARPYAPDLPAGIAQAPMVLAVDIPSGVDGLTGQTNGEPLPATQTVTFAALKPGLLLAPGRQLAGSVTVADIGLDCSRATIGHLEASDLAHWPRRTVNAHKWRNAVAVIGGSPGMTGAPSLSAAAALRAGAGYARMVLPGHSGGLSGGGADGGAAEAVRVSVDAEWSSAVLADQHRFGALVVGPGLEPDADELLAFLSAVDAPLVLDAGALTALGQADPVARQTVVERFRRQNRRAVLTPHHGEFARLANLDRSQARRLELDPIGSARTAAHDLHAVVVLKGPTTVIADHDGKVALSTAGDARLATAGSGDVLSGIIGAGLAGGLDPFLAAAIGVELHGRAALRGLKVGLVASDLPPLVAAELTQVEGSLLLQPHHEGDAKWRLL